MTFPHYRTNNSLVQIEHDQMWADQRAADAQEQVQAQRRRDGACLRCGAPERVNRFHCEQCHDETKD